MEGRSSPRVGVKGHGSGSKVEGRVFCLRSSGLRSTVFGSWVSGLLVFGLWSITRPRCATGNRCATGKSGLVHREACGERTEQREKLAKMLFLACVLDPICTPWLHREAVFGRSFGTVFGRVKTHTREEPCKTCSTRGRCPARPAKHRKSGWVHRGARGDR